MQFDKFSLNLHGRLVEYDHPVVMGIINVTPDSFHVPSRGMDTPTISALAGGMVADGADIIDVGAYSSRPGALEVSEEEELQRLTIGIRAIRAVAPDIPLSVDTFRPRVARYAVEELGADIINDISGCPAQEMIDSIESMKVPYVLMHMPGTATTHALASLPSPVAPEVLLSLSRQYNRLRLAGITDIIIDPGIGFGKTIGQNYELIRSIPALREAFSCPVLIGVSRKSMITIPLGITAAQSLAATTTLNTLSIMEGASILRVHDVKACVEAIKIINLTYPNAFVRNS